MRALPAELSGSLAWLLAAVSHDINSVVSCQLRELGLTFRSYAVLICARERGNATQVDLARAVGLDKTTMVATIDLLEAEGLVERRASERDRRARTIHVTAQGARRAQLAHKLVSEAEAQIIDALDDGDGLHAGLLALRAHLRERDPSTGSCV